MKSPEVWKALTPEQQARVLEFQARADVQQASKATYLGICGDNQEVTDDLLENIAKGLKIDPWSFNQWIRAKLPRVIKKTSDPQKAASWQSWLLYQGVHSFTFSQKEMMEFLPFEVLYFDLTSDRLEIQLHNGTLQCRHSDIFLMVLGEVQTREKKEIDERNLIGKPSKANVERVQTDSRTYLDVHVRGTGCFRFTEQTNLEAILQPVHLNGSESGESACPEVEIAHLSGRPVNTSKEKLRALAVAIFNANPKMRVRLNFGRDAEAFGKGMTLLDQYSDLMVINSLGPFGARHRLIQTKSYGNQTFEAFNLYSFLHRVEVTGRIG